MLGAPVHLQTIEPSSKIIAGYLKSGRPGLLAAPGCQERGSCDLPPPMNPQPKESAYATDRSLAGSGCPAKSPMLAWIPAPVIARQGQHRVSFSANVNTAGGIQTTAADGKILRSHLLGLALRIRPMSRRPDAVRAWRETGERTNRLRQSSQARVGGDVLMVHSVPIRLFISRNFVCRFEFSPGSGFTNAKRPGINPGLNAFYYQGPQCGPRYCSSERGTLTDSRDGRRRCSAKQERSHRLHQPARSTGQSLPVPSRDGRPHQTK